MLRFRAPHYWIQGYMGGAPGTLAAFLLLGAYAQVILHKRFGYAWVGMLGVILIALSRQYEGLVLVVCLSLSAAVAISRFEKSNRKRFFKEAGFPIAGLAAAYVAAQLHYDFTITGNAFTLPYTHY